MQRKVYRVHYVGNLMILSLKVEVHVTESTGKNSCI